MAWSCVKWGLGEIMQNCGLYSFMTKIVIVRVIFCVIDQSFDEMHFTCNLVDLRWV